MNRFGRWAAAAWMAVVLASAGCSSFATSSLMPQNWFKKPAAQPAVNAPTGRRTVVASRKTNPSNTPPATVRVDPSESSLAAAAVPAKPVAQAASPGVLKANNNTIPAAKDVGL